MLLRLNLQYLNNKLKDKSDIVGFDNSIISPNFIEMYKNEKNKFTTTNTALIQRYEPILSNPFIKAYFKITT